MPVSYALHSVLCISSRPACTHSWSGNLVTAALWYATDGGSIVDGNVGCGPRRRLRLSAGFSLLALPPAPEQELLQTVGPRA